MPATLEGVKAKLDAVDEKVDGVNVRLDNLNGCIRENHDNIVTLKARTMTKDECDKIRNEKSAAPRRYWAAIATGGTLWFLFEIMPKLIHHLETAVDKAMLGG